MSFGHLRYFEAYDSGITFLPMTEEKLAKKLQDEFFVCLKENLQRESAFSGTHKLTDFFAVTRMREDTNTYIKIGHTFDKVGFAEVMLPCVFLPGRHFPATMLPINDDDFLVHIDYDGIVSTEMGSVNFQYAQESRFTPQSLMIRSASGKYGAEDDLPISAKSLDLAVSWFLRYVTYDAEKGTFSVDPGVLYGGMSRQNLFCGFIDYLNGRYLDFLAQGRPTDFRIFPEDIEKRLAELTHWHTWSGEHRSFLITRENGDLVEKRPADFLHCLLNTIENSVFLSRKPAEEFSATIRRTRMTLLEILYDLLKDKGSVFSAEQSMEEFRSIMDNQGYDPLRKLKDVQESCMNLATGEFAFYALLVRKLYGQIDRTRQQLRKKYGQFLVRKTTGQKGMSFETYAIVVNEVNQNDEPLCYNAKMYAFDRALNHLAAGFSLLRINEALLEQGEDASPSDHSGESSKSETIFLTNHPQMWQLRNFYERFRRFFQCHSLITAINHSFQDQDFHMSDLVYMKNILRLRHSQSMQVIRLLASDEAPYALIAEYESAANILDIKQEIKQAELEQAKRKNDRILNFALAVFGAFGVASSIVSILLSDAISMSISVAAMLMYLIIVAISYRRKDDK